MTGIKKTAKQRQAIALMSDPDIRYILLSGGSRSGKTFIACYSIIVRALKAAGSRHAILRFHFRDVKNAVGRDTMPKVLKLIGTPYTLDKTDWFFTLPNGSEIWLGGLDDDERVEKILGMEYSTIYYNEASQISYHAYTTAQTRLAQKTCLVNRAYVDCNPPTKSHWLHKLFLEHIDPETRVAVPNPERYAVLNMNPMDNRENLPEGYIEDTLASLPERKRRRFLDGEWLDDPEGALWKRSMIDEHRHTGTLPNLVRIVVGVDPARRTRPPLRPRRLFRQRLTARLGQTGRMGGGQAQGRPGYRRDEQRRRSRRGQPPHRLEESPVQEGDCEPGQVYPGRTRRRTLREGGGSPRRRVPGVRGSNVRVAPRRRVPRPHGRARMGDHRTRRTRRGVRLFRIIGGTQ